MEFELFYDARKKKARCSREPIGTSQFLQNGYFYRKLTANESDVSGFNRNFDMSKTHKTLLNLEPLNDVNVIV